MWHDDETTDEQAREFDDYQAYIDRLEDEAAMDDLWVDLVVAYALMGF
jgi:hypothetical protein